jgi:hypothetical protein
MSAAGSVPVGAGELVLVNSLLRWCDQGNRGEHYGTSGCPPRTGCPPRARSFGPRR